MTRVQLALRVPDLSASVAFHGKLFGAEPAKLRDGYANFAIVEPPLKLVLIEGADGEDTRLDHLGVEADTTDAVHAATTRPAQYVSRGMTSRFSRVSTVVLLDLQRTLYVARTSR